MSRHYGVKSYMFVYKLIYRSLMKTAWGSKRTSSGFFLCEIWWIIFFLIDYCQILGNEVNEMVIDAEECCGQLKQMNNKVFGVAISPAF